MEVMMIVVSDASDPSFFPFLSSQRQLLNARGKEGGSSQSARQEQQAGQERRQRRCTCRKQRKRRLQQHLQLFSHYICNM